MGEVKVWREKSEKPLPNNAFHYFICLVSCSIDIGNVTYILFDEEDPNSIHATRNILQAVADENDKVSFYYILFTLLHSIDLEVRYLRDKIMSIKVNNENFNFLLNLEPSMFDEKMDKARLSMEGTGSNWICILCFDTRFSTRKTVGTFECCRTIESVMECAKKGLENPSNLSEKDLKAATKGVKCVPLMKEIGSCFEALHADLSWMRFVIGIVLRVKANIKQWRESKEVKEAIKVVRNEFDDFVRQNTGLQP